MIVRFPDAPDVDGPLSLPEPSVYLIGGCDTAWQERAARHLEKHVGCLFICDPTPQPSHELETLRVKWSLTWLRLSSVVGCWIDNNIWDQLELGYVLGRCSVDRDLNVSPVVGSSMPEVVRALEVILDTLGFYPNVIGDFTEWASAVEAVAKGIR